MIPEEVEEYEARRRSEFIGIRIPVPLVRRVEKAAAARGISRNAWIRLMLEEHLDPGRTRAQTREGKR